MDMLILAGAIVILVEVPEGLFVRRNPSQDR